MLPGLSQEKREDLIAKMGKDKPLEDVLDEMKGVGNALKEAEKLAQETVPQGHSKKFKKERDADAVREDDEYSRSGNANATNQEEKERDLRHERNRENLSPDW